MASAPTGAFPAEELDEDDVELAMERGASLADEPSAKKRKSGAASSGEKTRADMLQDIYIATMHELRSITATCLEMPVTCVFDDQPLVSFQKVLTTNRAVVKDRMCVSFLHGLGSLHDVNFCHPFCQFLFLRLPSRFQKLVETVHFGG